MFQCSHSRSDLPQNDPYVRLFSCGSQIFDGYCYAFWGTFSLGGAVLLLLLYRGWISWDHTTTTPSSNFFASIYKVLVFPPSIDELQKCSFLALLYEVRVFVCLIGGLVLFLLMPLFGILTTKFKTHTNVYSWVTSMAFKGGISHSTVQSFDLDKVTLC